MRIIAENNGYKLSYSLDLVNRYVLWKEVSIKGTNFKFQQAVVQSPVFSKKIKSYFTFKQVQTALAKVHGMKYASRRFAR